MQKIPQINQKLYYVSDPVPLKPFLLWYNIHNKTHHCHHFKHTVEWHYMHSYCCAAITTFHLQNFFITPYQGSVSSK